MKKLIRKPIFTMICCVIFNVLFVLVFRLTKCTDDYFETFSPGFIYPILSIIFISAHIGGCIFLRKKKMKNALKGVFLYQLAGVICSIVYLIVRMLEINSLLDVPSNIFFFEIFHYIFSWWVIFIQPVSILVARLLGTWNFLIVALLYYILVYITGNSILSIKKDNDFEQRVKDSHLADNSKNK